MSVVHFQNNQWIVTDEGLDCPEWGYEIDIARLGERFLGEPELLEWPIHMTDKTWIDYSAFVEAFRKAASIHSAKIKQPFSQNELDHSIEEGWKHYRKNRQ